MQKRRKRTLHGLLASAAICMPSLALAQAANDGTQPATPPSIQSPSATDGATGATQGDVVVTGTRIRGIAPIGSPVIPLGQKEIQRQSVTSTTDLLRNLPQVNSYGADESTVSGGTAVQGSILNNTFARAANLRGLGTTATLVLLDGHRVAPGGQTGQLIDLDAIPQAAIGQVEVVADGASAIYGSDAVAGVINFVLRRKFDGAETSARYGFADGTDQYVLSQTFGHTWSSGSIFMAYEHQRRNPLSAADRPDQYNDDLRAYGGSAPPALAAPGNVIINGVPYPVPAGQIGANLTLGQLGTAGKLNLQSVWKGVDVLPRQTRDSVVMTFNQELSDKLEFFADGLFTHRNFKIHIPAANSGATGLTVPASNPFSPCAAGKPTTNTQGVACPANGNVAVQYSFINDLGNQYRYGTSQMWEVHGGFNLKLGSGWRATLSGTTSQDKESVRTPLGVNATALTAALAGSAPYNVNGVSGVLTRPPNLPALNLFCGAGGCNDAGTLDFISTVTSQPAHLKHSDAAVTADGTLFSLPGGNVRIALGAEYRHDQLQNKNLVFVAASPTLNTANITGAKRTVWAGYGELYVPIFGATNAVAGFERLELSLAGRVEHYSDFGWTANPKLGVNWTPISSVKLHGSYGRSFRAPTLSDINPSSTGVLRAIPLTAAQAASLGFGSVGNLSVVQTQGGTAGIKPEKARTFSAGIDFTPDFAPGLTLSLNYYDIVYRNRIDSPALNAGAYAALLSSSLYAPRLTFSPRFYPSSGLTVAEFDARIAAIEASTAPAFSGAPPAASTVVAISNGNRDNTGTLKTRGLDLSARYVRDLGPVTLRAGAIGTYVLNFDYSILPGAPSVDYVNQFSAIGSPLRLRGRGELGLDAGGLSATAYVNYSNRYSFPRSLLPAAAPDRFTHVASYTTVDLTVSYDTGSSSDLSLLRNLRISASAQNLFDKAPPLVLNGGASPILYDPTNASALGRLISIQVTKKW